MAKSNYIVRGGGDFSGLYKEFNNAQKKMKSFQTGMSKALKGLGAIVGTLAIGKVVKDSLSAASELESAFVGLESILTGQGKSFSNAKSFINDYISDGLIPLTDAITAYKNLAARGYSDEQIQTTLERLKDAAAFGRQSSYTLGEAVRSATEGLKNENSILVDNAGVTKNVAKMWDDYAKSIGKNRNQLTQQEKIQAEVNGILQETQWQVGDAAKYTNTYAGRLSALKKTLFDIKVNLGNAFMPIANIVLPLLQSLANKLASITSSLAAFTQALFGKAVVPKQTIANTQEQVGAVEDLGDATEKAGKQAKKAMAGFDELNILSKADAGGSGAGGIIGGASVDGSELTGTDDGTGGAMGQLATKAQEMAEKARAAFESLRDGIVENKNIILPALGAIAGALVGIAAFNGINNLIAAFKTFKTMISLAWTALLAHPMVAVAAAIGALVGAFIVAYNTNDEFRASVDRIWETIKNALTPVIQTLGDVLTWLWQSVIVPVGKVLIDILKVAFEGVSYSVEWLWKYILKPLGEFIIAVLGPILSGLATIITTILKVAVEALIKVFEFLWYNVFKPLTQWLGDTFKPVFEDIGEGIRLIIGGLQKTFEGLIEFITGVFTGDWDKAWNGVKKVFEGVFDSLYGIVKAPLNLIIRAINKVIGGVNKFRIDIPDWAAKIADIAGFSGGSIGFNIPKIPELATGAITDVNNPFMAIVGDNKTQREVISPLDDLLGMITTAVSSAVGNNQGSNINLTVKIGEDTIGERVISYINDKTIMTGESPILI